MFHQLHCLDYVRKALYPEYYVQDDVDRLYWMHIGKFHFPSCYLPLLTRLEHCVDYLRQALMCFADATVRLLPCDPFPWILSC